MLLCLFGYMDLLIIIKWQSNFKNIEYQAPSIITTVVGMFLDKGRPDGSPLFYGQQVVSILMVSKSHHSQSNPIFKVIFVACVPWMLFAKPFLMM